MERCKRIPWISIFAVFLVAGSVLFLLWTNVSPKNRPSLSHLFSLLGEQNARAYALREITQPAPAIEEMQASGRLLDAPVPLSPLPYAMGTGTPQAEHDGGSGTRISALRLNELAALGHTVLFEKNGISLELPSSWVEQLALAPNQMVEVVLSCPAPEEISVAITVDGLPYREITGAVLHFPCTAVAQVTCLEDGQVLPVACDDGGIGKISPEKTGLYRLVPQATEIAEQPAPEAELPFDIEPNAAQQAGFTRFVICALLLAALLALFTFCIYWGWRYE